MKTIGFIIISMSLISHSWAFEYGLGVSAKSYDYSIYLPFEISNTILIEPYYSQSKYENSDHLYSNKSENEEVGLGLFQKTIKENDINLYFGMRVGYAESNYYYQSSGSFNEEKASSYRLGPVIGFEYSLLKKLTLSGEAEWKKSKLDGYSSSNGSRVKKESNSQSTDTRVILRYYLN